MVCLNYGRENGKTVLCVERSIEVVAINTGYFLLKEGKKFEQTIYE
jgi:hypothetical protein